MSNVNATDTNAVEINFQDIFKKISKHYLKIVMVIVFCVVAAIVFSYVQTPIYRATSRILVDSGPPKILKVENTVLPDYTDRTNFFNSQIEIFKSHSIADIVFNELGSYEPLNRRGKSESDLKPMGDEERVDALLKQVKINPIRMTQIIEVNAEDSDPKLAAHIADSWMRAYVLFSSVDQLVQKRSELQADLNQQSEFYKRKHPIILGLEKQIKEIDDKIENEKERLSQQADSSTNTIDLGSSITNIKILDRAQIPLKPVRPQKIVNVILGFVFGLFAGLALVFLLESIGQTIDGLVDIEQLLHLPCLAVIPHFKDKILLEDVTPAFISAKVLNSGVAESFRGLRTRIFFSNPDYPQKTFVVTSSIPMEGKTTVAVNLATVFAQSNERTILIDTDLRRPSLDTIFNADRTNGISDILTSDKEDIKPYIRKTNIPGLDLLTTGELPLNPSELIGSHRMEKLITKLSLMYDRIIFDTPPVLAATDAVVLSSKVHSTLLVVRAGLTHSQAALRSKQLLQSVRASIMGVVLNMVRFDTYGPGTYNYYYEAKKQDKPANLFSNLFSPTMTIEPVIDFFLFTALIAATLMYGSVSFFSQILLAFFSLIIFSLILFTRSWALKPVLFSPLVLLGAGMLIFVMCQLIPLPLGFLKIFSPAAYGVYMNYFPIGMKPEGFFSLSVYPFDTMKGILQYLIYGLIFLSVRMRLLKGDEDKETTHPVSLKKSQYLKLGCLTGVLSLLFHSLYDFNLHITANGMLFVFLLALGVGTSPNNYDNLFFRKSVNCIIFFGFLMALFALVQKLFFNGHIYWIGMPAPQPVGPFYNYDHFAGFMELCSAVAVGMVVASGLQSKLSNQYLLMAAVMIATIFFSSSRGGIMSFALSEIIFFFLIFKAVAQSSRAKSVFISIATVVSLSIILIIWLSPEDLLKRFHLLSFGNFLGMEGPINPRLLFYKDAMHVVHDFFVFGTGLNTFGTIFTQYRTFYYTGDFLRFAHNDYLQLISETGIGGIVFLFFFLGLFVSTTLRVKRDLR